MKIRTDFVTNSSSSSYCVSLGIQHKGADIVLDPWPEEADGSFDVFIPLKCSPDDFISEIIKCRSVEELRDRLMNALNLSFLFDDNPNASIKEFEDGLIIKFKKQLDRIASLDEISGIAINEYYYAWGEFAEESWDSFSGDLWFMRKDRIEALYDKLVDGYGDFRANTISTIDFKEGIVHRKYLINDDVIASRKDSTFRKVFSKRCKTKTGSSDSSTFYEWMEDQSFILTGFSDEKEAKYREIIERSGGVVKSRVSPKTNCLIYDPDHDQEPAQLKRAKYLSEQGSEIAIITEEEFLEVLKPSDSSTIHEWMKDKIFVLTGFSDESEVKYTELIEKSGGTVKSSTVLKTNYLVYNPDYDHETVKLKRAKELSAQGKDIMILTEEEFLRKIETAIGSGSEPIEPAVLEWKYSMLQDGTIRLDDYLGKNASITVPACIDGFEVSELGEGALSPGYTTFGEGRKLPPGQIKVRNSLKEIILSNPLKVIGKDAFAYSSVESVIIPDSVEIISEEAFRNCKSLKKISFGTGLKMIKKGAFSGLHEIPKWVLPEGLKMIDDHAFLYSSIEEIHIPATVDFIGKGAFQNGVAVDDDFERHITVITVYGKPESAAEKYAKANQMKFIAE